MNVGDKIGHEACPRAHGGNYDNMLLGTLLYFDRRRKLTLRIRGAVGPDVHAGPSYLLGDKLRNPWAARLAWGFGPKALWPSPQEDCKVGARQLSKANIRCQSSLQVLDL